LLAAAVGWSVDARTPTRTRDEESRGEESFNGVKKTVILQRDSYS